jgi:predicted transcriptional regulator
MTGGRKMEVEGFESLKKALDEASKNARLRELKTEQVLSREEMELVNELQAKANARGMKLVPERKIKNRAKFAQCIQQNWEYLRSIKYLTMQEKSFLLDILPNVGFLSNCLVDDVTKKSPIPLTQKDIADLLGTNKSKISKIVRSLMNKGIIARSETGIEGNNVRAYALFINPNIIFSGDKDAVNPTLKAMFSRVPKELNKLPEKLF